MPAIFASAPSLNPTEDSSSVLFLGSGAPRNFSFPRPSQNAILASCVLIVDDEPSAALAVRKHLENASFGNVHIENDASRAFERIETIKPDVVLLDIHMPVNGLSILEQIRKDDALCHIPVITVTCDTDSETKLVALELGVNDFLTKPVDTSELIARVKNTLYGKIVNDHLINYSSRLESELLKDELTGVANRRAFEFELSRRLAEWERHCSPISVVLVDIDHFKSFNDRYGHLAGDEILRAIAIEISDNIRDMDLTARYGGEEFAVVLPGVRLNDAQHTAERIRKAIEAKSISHENQDLRVQVSVGVACVLQGDHAETLIRRADTALYASKRYGRNRTSIHTGTKCIPVLPEDAEQKFGDETVRLSGRQQELAITTTSQSRILVVDDEPSVTLMVRKLLQDAGFQNIQTENDSTAVASLIQTEIPDLLLLDVRMPHITGMDILRELRENPDTRHVSVVFLTSTSDSETKIRALELGANDFLPKPVNGPELVARVSNTLLAKAQLDNLSCYSQQLEYEVNLRTAEVQASRREAFQSLARAAEIRDDETGKHVIRVGKYAAVIADELGFSSEQVHWLEHAAQLHDVGKIGIPDVILKKPGGLNDEEFEIMQSHCFVGSDILDPSDEERAAIRNHTNLGARIFLDCESPVMKMAAIVAESHHEKWDGTGYPHGLVGDAIPIEGRITAVADVFDALSTARSYKDAVPFEECFQMIQESSGTHFDPRVVEAFLKRKREIQDIFKENQDQFVKSTAN